MASDRSVTVSQLKDRAQRFVDDRDWAKYHNPKDVAVSITIEAAELVEVFQWVKGSDIDVITADPAKLQKLKDELADVMVYCVSMANVLGIDIAQAVFEKIRKTEAKYPVERIKGNYRKYKEL